MVYGSKRQQFWFADPWIRFCLDIDLGGAMIDVRPYAARLIRPCGVGTAHIQDASYPFIIQSTYRAGYFTFYAGEGAVKSCKFGTTEDPEDLTGVRLTLTGRSGAESIDYAYRCREAVVEGVESVEALVPQVDTRLSMRSGSDDATGYLREGMAFSPMYTLGIKKTVKGIGELRPWLKVEKAS